MMGDAQIPLIKRLQLIDACGGRTAVTKSGKLPTTAFAFEIQVFGRGVLRRNLGSWRIERPAASFFHHVSRTEVCELLLDRSQRVPSPRIL